AREHHGGLHRHGHQRLDTGRHHRHPRPALDSKPRQGRPRHHPDARRERPHRQGPANAAQGPERQRLQSRPPGMGGTEMSDQKWQQEFEALRAIILDSGLEEQVKWGQPCFTLEGRNVVLIHGFKEYCALLFFKGALMQDPKNVLIQQTENVQAARQLRFTTLDEIRRLEKTIKAYVKDAIALEKSGAKVAFKKTTEFSFPEELERKMDDLPALRTAFEELTPGRQRAYLLHFSSAKQAKTREARIEKSVQRILDGKGLDD
ncbi:conserved hypothetical protein, partial [Ricinus communis]